MLRRLKVSSKAVVVLTAFERVACHGAEYPDSRQINSFPDSRKMNSFPDSPKISPYFLPLKSICGGNCTVHPI